MRDIGLLKAYIVVTTFWASVITIANYGFSGLPLLPTSILTGLFIQIIGAIIGFGLIGLNEWLEEVSIKILHKPSQFRGMNISIGAFPSMKPEPEGVHTGTGKIFLDESLNKWFKEYESKNPKHARLMRSVAGIYIKNNNLPASPVKGGHGGATLRQHSEHVLKCMMEEAPKWKYVGHIGKSGKILQHPKDGTWQYEKELANSPILPLLAYLHDLGKVECYEVVNGAVEEIRHNHDTVGKRMLVSINTFWDLDAKDREILAMGIGYYHHIGSLPLWCDDAVRAATELLIHVDVMAGKAEGGVMHDYEDYAAGDPNAEFGAEPVSQEHAMSTDEIAKTLGIEIDDLEKTNAHTIPLTDDENEQIVVDTQQPNISKTEETDCQETKNQNKKIQATAKDSQTSNQSKWIFEIFKEIISEPGRINGKEKNRIGFKKNGLVYVNDLGWREAAAIKTGNASIATNPTGHISEATYLLLEELKARDALIYKHNGLEFSTKRALFRVDLYLPKHSASAKAQNLRGSHSTTWGYTIIFKSSLFDFIDEIKDAPGEFEIIGCGWGPTQAINKNKALVPTLESKTDSETEVNQALENITEEKNVISTELNQNDAKSIFKRLRDQLESEGKSDVPFSIRTSGGKTYQVARQDLLKLIYPSTNWNDGIFKKSTDENGNKLLCLEINEE